MFDKNYVVRASLNTSFVYKKILFLKSSNVNESVDQPTYDACPYAHFTTEYTRVQIFVTNDVASILIRWINIVIGQVFDTFVILYETLETTNLRSLALVF